MGAGGMWTLRWSVGRLDANRRIDMDEAAARGGSLKEPERLRNRLRSLGRWSEGTRRRERLDERWGG